MDEFGDRCFSSFEEYLDVDRVVVFGIGGGGDIVGTIPTARLFEMHGCEVFIGGIAWERIPNDPVIGPRSLEEISGVEKLSDTVGFVDSNTKIDGGGELAEVQVAKYYGEKVVLVDITSGVDELARGLEEMSNRLDIDLVIGIDVGGDVLARGTEENLKSPLADSICLSSLCSLSNTLVGVFGYGSDGELSIEELNERIKELAGKNGLVGSWGLTHNVIEEMNGLLPNVNTEASLLPVKAARGNMGEKKIRNNKRSVFLTPASTVTFYFDPISIYQVSDLASIIEESNSIDKAHKNLTSQGITTELDIEKRLLEEKQEK